MRTREEAVAPRCPFCDAALKRPEAMQGGESEQVQGGSCSCGAVYLVDPTGKNVGMVMAMALNIAAEKLGKRISDLDSENDYEDAVLSYDWRNHRSIGKVTGYMDGYGRMYVVRMRERTA